MDHKLLAVAGGRGSADLVVKNGKLVNVYSGEVYEGGVAVSGDRIAAIGDVDYTIGENTKIIDAKGGYITPGFVEGHIHPESTSLSIRPFAEIVLQHGTTVVMTDLHEVGVVGGLPAIEAVLEEAESTDLRLYFVVPSHVPFSPFLETSGGAFDPAIIRQALGRSDAVGLSECVGPYILAGFPDLLESIDLAKQAGGSIQGHLPHMLGKDLSVCLAAGVSTDHESLSPEECLEKLRNGCSVMVREGSAARSAAPCLEGILKAGVDTANVSLITDDLHTSDAVNRGHLDDAVRVALAAGTPFIKAIQMVSLNAARAFRLEHEVGGLAPGRRADLNITTGPEDFRVLSVVAGGRLVAENGKRLVSYPAAEHKPVLLDTMKLFHPITADDFKVRVSPAAKSVKVKAMQTLPWIPITEERIAELAVVDGVVQCDVGQDILHIAQVERYGKNGNVGHAFMGGFELKSGAIASSVGHDNHNIIVLGTNFEDMAAAVNRVVALNGGQVVMKDGAVQYEIAYPILGLLSDLSAEELSAEKEKLNAAVRELGTKIAIPFMFLSFICLAALPNFAVTDHGFIDVATQQVIDPILSVDN